MITGTAQKRSGFEPKVNLPNQFDIYEHNYTKLDNEIKRLTAEKEILKTEILAKFEEEFGHEGHSVISKMSGNTLQRVLNVFQDINEKKVKELLSEEMWKQVTVERVSQELFTSAIKNGDVSAILVADVTITKEVEKLVVRKNKDGKV